MPGTRSASTARKLGRDFIRAYQSLAGGETVQSTSPMKIEAGKMRRRREIGQRQVGARQPFARLGQPAEIVQVLRRLA